MQIKIDLWIMSHSLFLDWIKLRTLVEYRLSALLSRNVRAIPFHDGDYWEIKIDPLSPDEMEMLLDIAEGEMCIRDSC